MIKVPEFREVYRVEVRKNGIIRTICELRCLESGEQLSFGVARVSGPENYNKSTGKIIAYGNAMRFLFLKLRNGDIFVEDTINEQTDLVSS